MFEHKISPGDWFLRVRARPRIQTVHAGNPGSAGIAARRSPVRASPPRRHKNEDQQRVRSEEHTSELQSLMCISYAVFCLKKKKSIHSNLYSTHLKRLTA